MTARLALIGAPGAGKSTVAAALAGLWDCPLIDTDAAFAEQFGHTVSEAVIDDEAQFRAREEHVVVSALGTADAVVAVGSGAVESAEVQRALAAVPAVWLEVGLVDAARRTGLSGARPVSLGNIRGQFHNMLQQRAGIYARLADLAVPTDGRTTEQITADIAVWEGSE